MKVSVFNYQSSRQFLLDSVTSLQRENAKYSLRYLAGRMDISHTLLVMLLQGKRGLRVKHAALVAKGLRLSSSERMYLQALIQLENARDIEEKQLCQMWLSELHPSSPQKTKVLDEFEVFSNWIHMTLLSLSEVKDFNPDPAVIAKRLGRQVTSQEVRSAIARLKELNLITMDDEGGFVPTYKEITTADDVVNQATRHYHKQVMDLAKEAIEFQDVSRREYQSFSLSLPLSKLKLAKEMIRKFRSQLIKAMESEVSDEVYQMNIQFFQLTESPVVGLQREDEGVDRFKQTHKKEKSHAKN